MSILLPVHPSNGCSTEMVQNDKHSWEAGRIIPGDLHMEHLNRNVKYGMAMLGSNVTSESIQCIGTSIRNVANLVSHFESENKVPM